MKRYAAMAIILGLVLFGISSTFKYGNTNDFSNRGWPLAYKKYALDDLNKMCAGMELLSLRDYPSSCYGDQPLNKIAATQDLLIYWGVSFILVFSIKYVRKNT